MPIVKATVSYVCLPSRTLHRVTSELAIGRPSVMHMPFEEQQVRISSITWKPSFSWIIPLCSRISLWINNTIAFWLWKRYGSPSKRWTKGTTSRQKRYYRKLSKRLIDRPHGMITWANGTHSLLITPPNLPHIQQFLIFLLFIKVWPKVCLNAWNEHGHRSNRRGKTTTRPSRIRWLSLIHDNVLPTPQPPTARATNRRRSAHSRSMENLRREAKTNERCGNQRAKSTAPKIAQWRRGRAMCPPTAMARLNITH